MGPNREAGINLTGNKSYENRAGLEYQCTSTWIFSTITYEARTTLKLELSKGADVLDPPPRDASTIVRNYNRESNQE